MDAEERRACEHVDDVVGALYERLRRLAETEESVVWLLGVVDELGGDQEPMALWSAERYVALKVLR
jgi:hypothetical protein